MLDNFREWLSDNLRYILLGLAILAVLLLLFFGIKAITGNSSEKKDKEPEKKTEQEKKTVDSKKSDKDILEKNAYPEVNTLIESFYSAWGEKNVAKMKELTDNFNATDEEKVSSATYIESYKNINVYTRKGLDENSYVVFATYDLKFKDVDTPAPGLSELYVYKNENGKYVIQNDDTDVEVQKYMEKTKQEEDVKELIAETEEKLNAAMLSDDTLKKFEEELGTKANTAQMADNGEMLTARESCKVYSSANKNAEILGTLQAGEQVKKLENAIDNWIKVEYQGKEAYVFGDLVQ